MENIKLDTFSDVLLDDKEIQVQQFHEIVYFAENEMTPVACNVEIESVESVDVSLTTSFDERLFREGNHRDMENVKLKAITDALLENNGIGRLQEKAYFSENVLSPTDINIEVEGVGSIDFPLAISCIERLVSVSSKAKFGLREQTFVDEHVRNTHEIVREKLRVTIKQSSLTRVLNKMREELGLNENSVLSPHLHNMLIYSRGQFFDMHQDTEKIDNMVATLVIVLPSDHIGGDLIILQGDEKHVFSTQNKNEVNAKCIAFYADCMHKIEKVEEGYRVALTFNLVLNASGLATYEMPNQRLKTAIQEHFDESSLEHRELVYFLNHNYTERGLKWDLLKGNDCTNAMSILKVAKDLDLVPHLALVKICETYYTSVCDPRDNDPEPLGIIHSSITLSYWVNEFNNKLPYHELHVKKRDICWTKDLDDFEPYKSEYEGYQGNCGGNKDLWYRRTAVVLWAKSSQTTMNFMLNNHNAISDLRKLTLVPRKEKQVMEIIQKAGRYLCKKFEENEECLKMLVDIALYIQDSNAASGILSPFSRKILSDSTAESLAKLQNRYGIPWCIDILNKWKSYDCDIDNIDLFVEVFLQNKGAVQIAELLLDQQSMETDKSYAYHKYAGNEMSTTERLEKLCQIFIGCAVVQNVSILHKVIKCVIANPGKYPFIKLVDLFLKLKDKVRPEYYINFNVLRNYLVNAVDSELAEGKHSDNDWSIRGIKMSCYCGVCSEALTFLNSQTEVIKRWPINKKSRDHVSDRLKHLRLFIVISVERSGSPFKLIIKKKKSMLKEFHKRFRELKHCQAALHA